MLKATQFIESIQSTKTTALNQMVTDKNYREPLQAMVDAEAKLMKLVFGSIEDALSKFKVK
jgi:hypothetical protein